MGRLPICACGEVKLWHGVVFSSENSQHLTDWYTPSHVIHGIVFYALGWLVLRRATLGFRLVAATLLEAGWEVLENTPLVIDRYRTATIALGYEGDTIVNSLADLACCWTGAILARCLGFRWSLTVFLATELVLAWWIRDGLLLNIVMLVYPIDAVLQWQAGQ